MVPLPSVTCGSERAMEFESRTGPYREVEHVLQASPLRGCLDGIGLQQVVHDPLDERARMLSDLRRRVAHELREHMCRVDGLRVARAPGQEVLRGGSDASDERRQHGSRQEGAGGSHDRRGVRDRPVKRHRAQSVRNLHTYRAVSWSADAEAPKRHVCVCVQP